MPFLKSYKSLVQSRPDLSAAASAAGAITPEPDADGVVGDLLSPWPFNKRSSRALRLRSCVSVVVSIRS
jgi:hypothetical protein